MLNRWTTAITAGALVVGLAVPVLAQEHLSVPPVLDPAPEDALFVKSQFTPVRTIRGAVYGGNWTSQGEWQDLVLDVWEPAELVDEQFRPAVVFASGNFSRNLGTEQTYWMPWLVERGYVVASIEYRVRPEWPGAGQGILGIADGLAEGRITPLEVVEMSMAMSRDAQHDMQAAVRWLRANAGELRIDPSWISAAGYSAGGAITSRTVFNHEDPGDSGNPDWPSHVAAGLIGGSSYAPVAAGDFVQPGDPPTMWFHGARDVEVPIALSATPCAYTLAMGNVCEYHVYPHEGHGMSRPVHWPTVAAQSADFLYRHVLSAERVGSELRDVAATGRGGSAIVSGRLVTEDGAPLVAARVLGRATGAWASTLTGPDGEFTLRVPAPDHGHSAEVLVRYDGSLSKVAPTSTTVTARWGR